MQAVRLHNPLRLEETRIALQPDFQPAGFYGMFFQNRITELKI
jgi:hypothetical protein